MVITDRGKPKLEIRRLRQKDIDPLELLRGSVVKYESATSPIEPDEWENA